ncbi:T9SS type A sorting domain-containing protein [Microvirga sp. STR05]|uniref:T9SS type A sorting domain-containing protein n=1 Tax=Hymenobacter duratus TaxID=2771356 RepID=A0ABR8JKU6_9BACT|nr:T9SS type A sorting domain-containing protein [Hymenobacter duratus]MBD2716338.1 T9SS type A sorting domain-containing protein [Hymenobacter duratus]MBR7951253.1 T9SS type A sorting domain-containing protein [Microvirga sp. STR05]
MFSRTLLLAAALGAGTLSAQAQFTAVQSFNGTNNNTPAGELGYEGTPAFIGSTAPGTWRNPGDNLSFASNSAWRIQNATEGLMFRNRTTTAASTGNYIQFRVAAWGTNGGAGLDADDEINVNVSIDGGLTYTNTLRITGKTNGSGNGYWNFTPGALNSTTYVNGGAVRVTGPNTGNDDHNGDGFSNFRINLPNGALSVRFSIIASNNSADEIWIIDEVTVGSSAPLPVELKSFTAEATSKGTQVRWATASEKNNAGFKVQRGTTADKFETIGQVAGHGTSTQAHSYEWLDARPLSGTSYYRLLQTDTDGTETYSPAVAVQSGGGTKATFFPNPTTGSIVLAPGIGTVRYRILNPLGQAVLTGEATGGSTLDVQTLRAGSYFLELNTASGRQIQRFVREL